MFLIMSQGTRSPRGPQSYGMGGGGGFCTGQSRSTLAKHIEVRESRTRSIKKFLIEVYAKYIPRRMRLEEAHYWLGCGRNQGKNRLISAPQYNPNTIVSQPAKPTSSVFNNLKRCGAEEGNIPSPL
jgi:hypothetical protein